MSRGCRLLGFFVLAFFFLIPEKESSAAQYAYEIQRYQIDMEITRQNVYKISETIQVNFNESRHGIYRNIPLVNEVGRVDGSRSETRAVIRNVRCGSDEFELSRVEDNCYIKIGDPDEKIRGEKTYYITYEYNLGNDVLLDADEFYYNIIGTGWKDTTISNVTFAIHMPEAFEEEKIGMVYGGYGMAKTKGLTYRIRDNTIYGELSPDIILQPREALTVRIELPEGYFEAVTGFPVLGYVAIVIALAGMAAALFLWWMFGRDDPVVEMVEFYAPDGMNSVDLAFAYKGKLDRKDAVSLVVYLAQKGYLKIQQGTEKKPDKNTFTLIKVRDYDGDNEVERVFMNGLFSGRNRVTKSDLQNSFYKTINSIVSMVDNRANRLVLFTKDSLNKGWILYLMTIGAYAAAAWKSSMDYYLNFYTGLMMMAVPSVVFIAVFSVVFKPMKFVILNIGSALLGTGVGGVVYYLFLDNALTYVNPFYRYAYIFVVIASAVILFFNTYLSKRTPYGTEILGRIRGFRNFLLTAEKDRLETMVAENPQYFYEILPYTYVLDISDKWMKKFESITVEPPNWYSSYHYGMFDYMMFHHFMRETMSSATSSMTSSPHSSSGGGGGFSGGGSGGGGGGSW